MISAGVTEKGFNFFEAPEPEKLTELDPIYLSYFVEWNSFKNYNIAKKYGFHDLTHEWNRTHYVEQMDQIDSAAYLVHSWLKYPKFGHASATDYCSRMIRYKMLSREDAVNFVKKHDPRSVREFCEFAGYTEKEFWNVIDRFYNKDLFTNMNSAWVLKGTQ